MKLEARRLIKWDGGGGSPNMKNLMNANSKTARENWPKKKATRAFISYRREPWSYRRIIASCFIVNRALVISGISETRTS